MKPVDQMLGDLYGWRCPSCALNEHHCDPLVPWGCQCECDVWPPTIPTQQERP